MSDPDEVVRITKEELILYLEVVNKFYIRRNKMKFIALVFMLLSGCALDVKQYDVQRHNNCRDTCMDLNAYAYTFDLKDHSCKCKFYLKDFD